MLALHRPAHHRQLCPPDQDGPAKEEPRPWDFDWVLQEVRAGRIESTRFAAKLTGGGTSTGWAARGFIVGSPSGALPEFGLGMVPPARLGQVRALRTGPPLKAPPPSLTMPPPGAHGAGVAERPKSPPIKAPPSRRPDTAIDGTEPTPDAAAASPRAAPTPAPKMPAGLPVEHLPQEFATELPSQAPATPAPTPEPAMTAPLDGGMQCGASSAGSATEQPWQASPAAAPAPTPEPARPETEAEPDLEDMHAPAAAVATEPSPDLPADKQMIYAIVNEFLGTVTFSNPEAEASLLAVLVEESSLSLEMYALGRSVLAYLLPLSKWLEGSLCLAAT